MSLPVGQAATSYLDSSALVKRYLVEIGTPSVQACCADPIQTIAVTEHLHIIQSTNLDGLMIYSKGKLVEEAGVDHYYFLVSSKKALWSP